jgi:hypothetical protein
LYSIGIFAIEIFLLDLTEEKGLVKSVLDFSGVIDTAEIRQKNSVVNVPMKFFTLPSP